MIGEIAIPFQDPAEILVTETSRVGPQILVHDPSPDELPLDFGMALPQFSAESVEPTGSLLLSNPEKWAEAGGGASVQSNLSVDAVLATLQEVSENQRDSPTWIAARSRLDNWCKNTTTMRQTVESLLAVLFGVPGQETKGGRIFRFGDLETRVNMYTMSEAPTHAQRIESAVERIRDAVADLSSIEEKREAEVKALVTDVPAAEPYPQQIEAFTGITHAMRVLMARQLEEPFRNHLRDCSRRIETLNSNKNSDLPIAKRSFSDQCTDELFRLGLAIDWKSKGIPGYIITFTDKTKARTRYQIARCKEGGGPLGVTTRWHAKSVQDHVLDDDNPTKHVFLMDGATLGKVNCLRPTTHRRN